MAKKRYNVAIVGATGAVGGEMLRVLEERRFPLKHLRVLASARSVGRRIAFNGSSYKVECLRKQALDGIDLALFSAGAARSQEFAPEAVKRGTIVVDNSSAFRMSKNVPLIVPEVNPGALRGHNGLIANPNCSTIILVVALAPIHAAVGIKRIVVSTYQSVSGAGAKAMAQLCQETQDALKRVTTNRLRFVGSPQLPAGRKRLSKALPGQIAFNLIPQIEHFLSNRYTKEEMKMVHETRKILNAPNLGVSAMCVRVPVFISHSEAVWIETKRALSVAEARALLKSAPGIELIDDPARGLYPMPIHAANRDEVLVGRLRRDESVRNGLTLWISGDNLRKGAATNAVQIAELIARAR